MDRDFTFLQYIYVIECLDGTWEIVDRFGHLSLPKKFANRGEIDEWMSKANMRIYDGDDMSKIVVPPAICNRTFKRSFWIIDFGKRETEND